MSKKTGRRKPKNQRWRGNGAQKLGRQMKKANTRAKYGPRMKPQPVTVTRPGFEPYTVDQDRFKAVPVAPSLDTKAREAGFANYTAYLASPEWKARRREVLQRDGWRCIRCRGKRHLQVHHRWYGRVGAERLESLETLCQGCHKRLHHG